MFKIFKAEEIRRMNYEEFKKYVYAIPRDYEKYTEFPTPAKINGRTYKVCKILLETISDVHSKLYYTECNPIPGEKALVKKLDRIKAECQESMKEFKKEDYFVVPMTEESYVFTEVREAYAEASEKVLELRQKAIEKKLRKEMKGKRCNNGLTYKEAARRILEVINENA